MLAGGIYDQLGGGFARYSVDADWLVPHFEKMLYDNAQLARAYLHGWQALGPRALPPRLRGDPRLGAARDARPRGRLLLRPRRRLRGRGGPLLRLDTGTDPRGPRRRRGGRSIDFYGVTEAGNFEGRNILHLAAGAEAPEPPGLAEARRTLYEARAKRVWPSLDDKRLTSWNALTIAALAEAGAVLGTRRLPGRSPPLRRLHPRLPARPRRPPAAHLQGRQGPPQRLPGGPRLPARGAPDPLRIDLRTTLVRRGRKSLADTMIAHFGDPERGGFYSTSNDHEALIARRKEIGDHPIPSGQLLGRLRPAAPRGPHRRARLRGPGRSGSSASSPNPPPSTPRPSPTSCRALDFHLSPTKRSPWSASDLSASSTEVVRSAYRPHVVLAGGPEGSRDAGATRGADHGRRPARRLRLRALHLPGPGHATRKPSPSCSDARGPAGSSRSQTA